MKSVHVKSDASADDEVEIFSLLALIEYRVADSKEVSPTHVAAEMHVDLLTIIINSKNIIEKPLKSHSR